MKKLVSVILILIAQCSYSQGDVSSYPTNYFSNPLDIPLVLSGTFGELRTNHFHAGLDIKTLQKEGLNVIAAANGYVSRIKVSLWGYGKVIYVKHPNGYTTVYAHLQKFNDRIESYIKKQQYKKESFEIQLFPGANELPVTKDEIIAFSGSTGGFVGPHLHFEIRDSKTEKPINPFYFGIQVSDSKKPRLNNLMGYSLNANSHINKVNVPVQLSYRKLENGDYLANKINAFGSIGFGVNVYDQLDGAYNKNGIYSLTMAVNGKKVHEFKASSFAFSETKYINLLVDYNRLEKLNQRVQKTFTEPSNKLNMYPVSINNGFITVEDGLTYSIDIVAKDFEGNQQKITIPVVGKKDTTTVSKPIVKTPYKIKKAEFNKFTQDGVTVAFPKNTFYTDFYLDFKVENGIAKVHTPTLPLDRKYTLTFDVSKFSEIEKKQLYIASIKKNGNTSYQKTVKKETTFYTTTKNLGTYTLKKDTFKPSVKLHNVKNEQWLTHFKNLQVKISDKGSGIKSYRGEIDGKWILMEYNVKSGLLTYDFNDQVFSEAKHNLKVTVTDNVGNTTTLTSTFFRKK
ncbi:M23 family metallopeptidase [Lutibacter holmesii]|uniref:M23 family metallopeptidase n=1 Tax=Lutibacter holmesii TaxID=1137985 RepID=A0ABW3WPI9_9FLAO